MYFGGNRVVVAKLFKLLSYFDNNSKYKVLFYIYIQYKQNVWAVTYNKILNQEKKLFKKMHLILTLRFLNAIISKTSRGTKIFIATFL